MALFQTAAAGSGILTPIFPSLTLRFSFDGLGLVFEDPSNNFLLVWNADYQARAIEYSPGLFTPVLVEHTACEASGNLGGLINPGPSTWTFKSYPAGLGYDFEVYRYATASSGYGFPSKYTGSTNPSWDRDDVYITHKTGPDRRMVTWPPFRGIRYNPSGAAQADAWVAMQGWCTDQLRRPWAHISAPGVPFKGIEDYNNFTINRFDANRKWWQDKTVKVGDRGGTKRDWNHFDPAHNAAHPQFALMCASHPLGAVLLWMIGSQMVQGAPPGTVNQYGSYSYPNDQERSCFWTLELDMYCVLAGFDYMDPDLKRDWWGGLRGSHSNGGLGWTPRDHLQTYIDILSGPDFGGMSTSNSRYVFSRSDPQNDNGFNGDGQHQPYMKVGTKFDYNNKHYFRCFGSDKGFHRYMLLWVLSELKRCHNYIQSIDPTEFLIASSRASQVFQWMDDIRDYAIDAGFLYDIDGTPKGYWRQRYHTFQAACTEFGFESFDAIDTAIRQAIVDNPINPTTGNAWVYPGTDSSKMDHLFVKQFTRWGRGTGLWVIQGGRPQDTNGNPDSEAHICGIPAYAISKGTDAYLDQMFTTYSGEISDKTKTDRVSHYEPYWRAKELASGSNRVQLTPIQVDTYTNPDMVIDQRRLGIALGTITGETAATSLQVLHGLSQRWPLGTIDCETRTLSPNKKITGGTLVNRWPIDPAIRCLTATTGMRSTSIGQATRVPIPGIYSRTATRPPDFSNDGGLKHVPLETIYSESAVGRMRFLAGGGLVNHFPLDDEVYAETYTNPMQFHTVGGGISNVGLVRIYSTTRTAGMGYENQATIIHAPIDDEIFAETFTNRMGFHSVGGSISHVGMHSGYSKSFTNSPTIVTIDQRVNALGAIGCYPVTTDMVAVSNATPQPDVAGEGSGTVNLEEDVLA